VDLGEKKAEYKAIKDVIGSAIGEAVKGCCYEDKLPKQTH